ncbi:hypothetical protein LCGC14_2556080 [marine sediment metagenome]|uniref:Uncharacterized protein n=1 Tax=marine sediment metagenome TaxID=412755 RepID=A0A0F9B9D8_9ZZZZ
MSNVRITAIGDEALSVEVLLGDQNRAWRDLEAGESADLAVGGNQTLRVGPARDVPSTFITPDDEPAVETPWVTDDEGAGDVPSTFITPDDEPAVETPWVTGEEDADLPVGVDVTAEDDGRETQSIGPGDIGEMGVLFGGIEAKVEEAAAEAGEAEAEAEASVVSTLEADSPLEVGSLSDLPSPFDTDEKSAKWDAEEAEDTGEEAQA